METIKYKNYTITFKGAVFKNTEETLYLVYLVEENGSTDDFTFGIGQMEGAQPKNKDFDVKKYKAIALERVKQIIDTEGIKGNQSFVFDFIDSDFVSR
jgi:hypothetical protein